MAVPHHELLSLFDHEMRSELGNGQTGCRVESSVHVRRLLGSSPDAQDNCVIFSRLDATNADAAIQAEIEFFTALNRPFEWKLYGHDQPRDLADRLKRLAFVPQGRETVVVADLPIDFPADTSSSEIRVRRITRIEEFDPLLRVQEQVWSDDQAWLRGALASEMTSAPSRIEILLAEAAGAVAVATSWMRLHPGTHFASIWGAATLAAHRGRGIYRSLIKRHAATAQAAGAGFLAADANENSRPMLERVGFRALTEVQGFVWTPAARTGCAVTSATDGTGRDRPGSADR